MGQRSRPRPGIFFRLVGWFGEVLITLGLLLFLFVAWQLWWTDVESNRIQSATVNSLVDDFERKPATPQEGEEALTPNGIPKELGKDGAFAILRIPRFGADYARPILEGTDYLILTKGVGHYVGTVGPGKVGNFALAGHRTTYGRPFHTIDTLEVGDRIVVETRATFYVYEVATHEIVLPSALEVIAPVPDLPGQSPTEAMLTMTSCHPKYSAQQRYIIHARLAATVKRADWVPAQYLTVPPKAG